MLLVSASGCTATVAGPNLGLWSYPIPLSPYFQKREEDAYWNKLRYKRSLILGPMTAGAPEVGAGSALGRRGDAGLERPGPSKAAFPGCTRSAKPCPHRERADCGLYRSGPGCFRWSVPPSSIT